MASNRSRFTPPTSIQGYELVGIVIIVALVGVLSTVPTTRARGHGAAGSFDIIWASRIERLTLPADGRLSVGQRTDQRQALLRFGRTMLASSRVFPDMAASSF